MRIDRERYDSLLTYVLKLFRTTADYFLSKTVTVGDKQVAIKQTEKLLEILAETK